MSRNPIVPTPEQMVQDAVAYSRLSGYEVTEGGFRAGRPVTGVQLPRCPRRSDL